MIECGICDREIWDGNGVCMECHVNTLSVHLNAAENEIAALRAELLERAEAMVGLCEVTRRAVLLREKLDTFDAFVDADPELSELVDAVDQHAAAFDFDLEGDE